MTVYAVVYDHKTGEIKNRVSYETQQQLRTCAPGSLEISSEEYMHEPELYKKVDPETKELVDKE